MDDDMLAKALAAAQRAAEDQSRGTLMWRINGRECRRTAFDEMTMTGAGRRPCVYQLEGIDLDLLT
jgi:hypothetical protein